MPVLNQALQAQAPQQAPQDPLGELMSEYQRLKSVAPKPMFTPEQAASNREQNDAQVDIGTLGALSGDRGISHAGGSVLQRALQARQPMKTARGMFDPLSGETAVDPAYQEQQLNQQRQFVLRQAMAWQEQRQRAAERQQQQADMQDFRRDMQDERLRSGEALRLTLAGMKAQGSGAGQKLRMVQTADGGYEFVPVVAGPVTGSDGAPIKTPGSAKPPKETMPTGVQKTYLDTHSAMAQIDMALGEVQKNPAAFGLQNALPDFVTQRVPGDQFKGGVGARAAVANIGSKVIHDRSGATVTIAEMPRLAPFIPGPRDDAEATATKLKGLKQQLTLIAGEIEAGFPQSQLVGNLRGRPGATPSAGTAPPVGVRPGAGAPPARGTGGWTYVGSE